MTTSNGRREINIHAWNYENDPEYRALIDFIRENQPVSAYSAELNRWNPMKYGGRNGPLTIAMTLARVIVTDDDELTYTLKEGI